jgi:peptidoglycan/xylan/chitin deacetylase (PgdA/CDA1 family)
VRLWPFPGEAPNVFGLRLDTDACSKEDIRRFADCSRALRVPFTWFVDTGSHDGFLDAFAEMKDQEVGIHCYRHVLYNSVDDYRTDIRLARAKLVQHDILPVGYAAPFGEWSEELGVAIDDSRLLYSSEFSLGYDGFPFLYRTNSKQYATPQVPVHPVSTGALRRAGYTRERMVRYYASVLRRRIGREEPLFLFDHPVHKNHEVMQEVITDALSHGAVPMRMGEYLEWWRRREAVLRHLSLSWEGGALTSQVDNTVGSEPTMLLKITTPAGGSLQPIGGTVRLHAGSKHSAQNFVPDLDDLRRAREFDLRTAFGVAFIRALRRLKS